MKYTLLISGVRGCFPKSPVFRNSCITAIPPFRHIHRFSTLSFVDSIDLKNRNNPVERFIRDKIRLTGPISVSEFMQLSVGSQVGYYATTKQIFGEKGLSYVYSSRRCRFWHLGDFVTSPELSQMFGELVAVWVVRQLEVLGHTGPWQLVELGPGSGALMDDFLRVLHKLKATDVSVHMVEMSEQLVDAQEKLLCEKPCERLAGGENPCVRKGETRTGLPIHWHNSVQEVPEKFSVFVANEFFDALPIHQFKRGENDGKWREVCVSLNPNNEDRLCFMLSKDENIHTKTLLPAHIRADDSLTEWECSPISLQLINQIADRCTNFGGFALVVDYGHNGSRRTHSLRAYRRHLLVNPLEAPGQVDITADVDFGAMARAVAERCLTFGPTEQRRFLVELGIHHRLNYLLGRCRSREERQTLLNSFKMLIGNEIDGGMGTRFKAFSMFPNTTKKYFFSKEHGGVPAGFYSATLGDK